MESMKYIHKNQIVHRDLKPTNILIASDGTVKIFTKIMTIEEQTKTLGVILDNLERIHNNMIQLSKTEIEYKSRIPQ